MKRKTTTHCAACGAILPEAHPTHCAGCGVSLDMAGIMEREIELAFDASPFHRRLDVIRTIVLDLAQRECAPERLRISEIVDVCDAHGIYPDGDTIGALVHLYAMARTLCGVRR